MRKLALLALASMLAVPAVFAADADRDFVDDAADLCPNVVGTAAAQGCPQFRPYSGDRFDKAADHVMDNKCLFDLVSAHGALLASFATGPFCPSYRVIFTAPVRRCDILFPAVVDPLSGDVLSRGPAVLVE